LAFGTSGIHLLRDFKEILVSDQVWWHTAVISATWELEVRGSQFNASPGKVSKRPYLKKTK
jgi:hypothetical protein